MIVAEAFCYQGQSHPCYGVQRQVHGLDTVFVPWVHDGCVVYWGQPQHTRSQAMDEARSMAVVMNPRFPG